jgi:transcriptional regulator with GAF, ATPase, and Fis domain
MHQNENAILLSLSREITHIRDKDDLLSVIHRHLKPHLQFNDAVVAVIDKEAGDYQRMLVADPEERRRVHRDFGRTASDRYSFYDGIFDVTLAAEGPLIFDLDTIQSWPIVPQYIQFAYDTGIRECVTIGLRSGREMIGVFFLFMEHKGTFTPNRRQLLTGIVSQLAIVVSSILTHEELLKRELEKSFLLSISNDMTSVRTKEDLYQVIDRRIDSFDIRGELLISVVNEDRETCSSYIYRPVAGSRHHEQLDFPHQKAGINSLDGEIVGDIIYSGSCNIYDLEELTQRPDPSSTLQFWYDRGMRELIGFPLKAANENVGGLWLFLPEKKTLTDFQLALFKGFCSQIAVALLNIRANDQIAKQLTEINQYKHQLEEENSYLLKEIGGGHDFKELIGSAPAMQEVFHLISRVADSRSTVILLGETGTGKELIARAIHDGSPRRDKMMIKVNCAALPEHLIESELFGHEKGSFTGAIERKLGKFELANNGTLFLDEIGELPLDLQVKLLRVLQEREIERIGGRGTIPVDVRIIAATNRNIEKEVAERRFRADLYYRLNVFPIVVPPLRDRKADIPLLAGYFIERYSKYAGKRITGISEKFQEAMMAYDWPGNVRELEHLIERSILLTPGHILKESHLPGTGLESGQRKDHFKTMEENERDHILSALKKCNGKISGPGGAAELLDIHVSTLNARIRKLGIKKNRTYQRS